jgi:hypothetical protein
MEDKAPSQRPEPNEKNKNIYLSFPKVILSFCLLALGFGSISLGNLMTSHGPYFFYVYSNLGTAIFYFVETAITPIGYLLIGIAVFLFISPLFVNLTSIRIGSTGTSFQQEDIKALRAKAEQNPDKIEPIWDLGRANLQEYFNRNLSQISNIYRVSVVVMIVGFLLITIGIFAGFTNGSSVFTPALVGVVAGVITEFIGATFLFMYRATVQQASEYMRTLERINRVGMATKILDTMSDESKGLRDETKATLVKLLFAQNSDQEEVTKDLYQQAENRLSKQEPRQNK